MEANELAKIATRSEVISKLQLQFSKDAVSLFCQILGLPDSQYNYLVGDDPHGIAEISESYWFKMSDIYAFLSEFDHWLELYGSVEELRKVVRQWYYLYVDPETGETAKPEINFKSWLMGLRPTDIETLPAYKEQKEREKAESAARVEQLKKDILS